MDHNPVRVDENSLSRRNSREDIQLDQSLSSNIHKSWMDLFNAQAASVEFEDMLPEKFRLWDEQIASLDSLLALARSRKRALAPPILKLPEEVVFRILSLVVKIERESMTGSSDLQRSWLGLSYVCRAWRYMLLGSTIFWTDLPTTMIPLWELFLQRSQSDSPLPLTVHGKLKQEQEQRIKQMFMQTQLQLKSISFSFTDDIDIISVISIASSLPNLEYLRLCYIGESSDTKWVTPDSLSEYGRRSLPLLRDHLSHMFNAASNLCDIDLSACIFPWNVTLPNLRRLRVCAANHGRTVSSQYIPRFEEPFTVAHIAKSLSRMPLLEELDLSEFHTSSIVTAEQSPFIAQLPCLQKLNLFAIASHNYGLWQLLHVNLDASISITSHEVNVTELLINAALSSIATYVSDSGLLATSLFIQMPTTNIFKTGTAFTIKFSTPHPSLQDGRDVLFDFRNFNADLADILYNWVIRLPRLINTSFNQLRCLAIRDLDSLPKDVWIEVLSAAPRLQNLSVYCIRKSRITDWPAVHPIACLLSALTPPRNAEAEDRLSQKSRESATVPSLKLALNLQDLELSDIEFTYSAHLTVALVQKSESSRGDSFELQDALTAAFKARLDRGYPLSKLLIHKSLFSRKALQQWRSVIADVHAEDAFYGNIIPF